MRCSRRIVDSVQTRSRAALARIISDASAPEQAAIATARGKAPKLKKRMRRASHGEGDVGSLAREVSQRECTNATARHAR